MQKSHVGAQVFHMYSPHSSHEKPRVYNVKRFVFKHDNTTHLKATLTRSAASALPKAPWNWRPSP